MISDSNTKRNNLFGCNELIRTFKSGSIERTLDKYDKVKSCLLIAY